MRSHFGYGILSTERRWEESAVGQPSPARIGSIQIHILILLLLAGMLTACTRSLSRPPVALTPGPSAAITIDQVQVNQGAGVYVTGHSTLPDGACVQTELLADQKVAEWWPREVCVEIDANQWEILAALGREGAPGRLDPKVAYQIHAWNPQDPSGTSTRFPFTVDEE